MAPDWNALLTNIETVETQQYSNEPVEAPSALVTMLSGLRLPGPNGGRQHGFLPVTSMQEFDVIRRTLRAAAAKLTPPASVTTKAVYAEDDEITQLVKGDDGTETSVIKIRDGAVPVRVRFSVTGKRGAKSKSDTALTVVPDQPPADAPSKPAAKSPARRAK